MFATADLYGGGLGGGTAKAGSNLQKQVANATKNNLMQAVDDFIGRGEVFFTTKTEMGFANFDGQFIRIGKATASLGIKAVYAYAVFPFIDYHPESLVFQKKSASACLIWKVGSLQESCVCAAPTPVTGMNMTELTKYRAHMTHTGWRRWCSPFRLASGSCFQPINRALQISSRPGRAGISNPHNPYKTEPEGGSAA